MQAGTRGLQGFKGDKGDPGNDYEPMIGNVETLDPALPATVSTNIDEEQNVVYFNFGIPQGIKGDTGDTNLVSFEIENGMLKAYDEQGNIYNLGMVAMEPRGEYSATTSYEKLNTVLYNDSTYMALKPSLGNPPTDTEYWQLIGGGLTREDIVDNLNSNDATKMLSAKQGKVIDAKLEGKISYFDTIATMKLGDLKEGNLVETKGYYTSGDGGGAKYEIVDDNTLTEDGAYIHELSNGLFARMIIENETINFRQLGAKPDDNTFDNKNYLLKYQTICNTLGKQIKLIIPSGTWYFSPTHLSRVGGFNIEGIGSSSTTRTFINTKIVAIDDQDYVWKFGGASDMGTTTLPYNSSNTMNRLKSLTFESASHTITYGCLVLEYSCYGFYDEIFFNNIVGTGLYIRSCWENYFGIMSFRGIQDFSTPCMRLAPIRLITDVSANISATRFDKLMFENTAGDLIKSDLTSEFVHCQIGEINVEYTYNRRTGETLNTITDETDYSDFTPMFLINGNGDSITIDTINWTGTSSIYRYAITASGNYFFKSLFNSIGGGTTQAYRFSYNIGKISSRTLIQILTAISPYPDGFIFYVGSYVETAASDAGEIAYSRFDCKNIGQIDIGSIRTKVRYGVRAVMENAIELYKYGFQGSISTDDDSWSKTKLVVERYGNNQINLKMNYPFPYDESKSSHWILRIKTTGTGAYYFTLRGFHNESQVNQTYSASGLSANTWITIPITMNYDFGSQIIIIQPNCKFDTLTYVSWE